MTRAEIEEIRGVVISKGTLDNLLEAGWIKPKGRRQTPGRPVTWVTTAAFLEHFGLESCDALPGVEELRAAGLLDSRNNAATLGVQGTLPPNDDPSEDEDVDDEIDDDRSAGIADDAYEAGVLARLEGAEVVDTTAAEASDGTDTADDGEASEIDDVTGDELSEDALAALQESEGDLAEQRDDPDVADIADESIPDEYRQTPLTPTPAKVMLLMMPKMSRMTWQMVAAASLTPQADGDRFWAEAPHPWPRLLGGGLSGGKGGNGCDLQFRISRNIVGPAN